MAVFEIKIGTSLWQALNFADLTALTVERSNKNVTYLAGKVKFTGVDYTNLLNKRFTGGTQIECRWGGFFGMLSLDGDWSYDRKLCELTVSGNSQYDRFKTILTKEYIPAWENIQFDHTSYSINGYGTLGLNVAGEYYEDYQDAGSVSPPELQTYDGGTTYGAANDLGGGKFSGDLNRFVYLSGFIYASLQDDNTGNSPTEPDSEFWAEISDLQNYKQERALFTFPGAEFNEQFRYWWKASEFTNTYTLAVIGYDIKQNIYNILIDNGFDLRSDWLDYAAGVNADYDGLLYIVNTEAAKVIKLQELIEYIEKAFNCEYFVDTSNQLYFLHKSERSTAWSGSLPAEHDLSSYDIFDFSNDENKIKRHRLKFSDSPGTTHSNSVIEYFNIYSADAEITSSFEVDFVYGFNEGGVNCLVTIDSVTTKIKYTTVWNPYLIPALLHEQFYLFGREFTRGELNENLLSLTLDYLEKSDRELQGNYDINNWDAMTQIKINGFAGSDARYALMEKVVYSIDKHNYKISLKTKIQ